MLKSGIQDCLQRKSHNTHLYTCIESACIKTNDAYFSDNAYMILIVCVRCYRESEKKNAQKKKSVSLNRNKTVCLRNINAQNLV